MSQQSQKSKISPLTLRHPKGELRTLTWKSWLHNVALSQTEDFVRLCESERKKYSELKKAHGLQDFEVRCLQAKKCARSSFRGETLHRIYIDVLRTRGELEFFRLESTRRFLLEVLLLWCITNKTEYTQGMNDILATITMAILGDYALLKALHQKGKTHPRYPRQLLQLVIPAHMGSDALSIFSGFMLKLPAMFSPDRKGQGQKDDTLIECLRFVQSRLLKEFDSELWEFLEKCGAPPELYMLKWVRLLFSREFELPQVLMVWDELVMKGGIDSRLGFGLVEYLCVCLLRFVRYELLNYVNIDDESSLVEALRRILRFPSVPDIQSLVNQAKELRSKFLTKYPTLAMQNERKKVGASESQQRKAMKTRKLPSRSAFDFISDSSVPVTRFKEDRDAPESPSAFEFLREAQTGAGQRNAPTEKHSSSHQTQGEAKNAFDFADFDIMNK